MWQLLKRQRKNFQCGDDTAGCTDTEDTDFHSTSEDDGFFGLSEDSTQHDYTLICDEEKLSPEIQNRTAASSKNQNQLQGLRPFIDFKSSTFRPLLEETDAYVDKTMFIRYAIQGPRAKLVMAPRRFMKSVNMDTLKTFLWIVVDEKGNAVHNTKEDGGVCIEKPVSELTENYKLFKNHDLQIYQCHCEVKHTNDFLHCENKQFFYQHCGKHPVLYADFKGIGGTDMWEVIEQFRKVLRESYQQHAYLLRCDGLWWSNEDVVEENKFSKKVFAEYYMDKDVVSCAVLSEYKREKSWKSRIIDGFVLLSKILQTWFKEKIFVLIDEYDHPILKATLANAAKESFIEELVYYIQSLMSDIIKNNDANVSHVLLNACVQLAQVLSGEGNNVEPYPFLHDHLLCNFYGFTEQDIDYLLEKDEFKKYQNKRSLIRQWYNKYQVAGKSATAIYSSWSVLHYLEYGVIQSYWFKSGYVQGLKKAFADKGIQNCMEKLFRGKELKIKPADKLQVDHILKLKNLLRRTKFDLSFEEQCLFLQYISNHGYLNVINVQIIPEEQLELKIPNLEIRVELGREFYSTKLFIDKYCITHDAVYAYKQSVNLLDDCKETTFTDLANTVCKLFSNNRERVQHEFEFHGPLYTFLKQDLQFQVFGESPALLGKHRHRVDIVILRDDEVGIILEIKRLDSAEQCLKQIVSKGYLRTFEEIKTKAQKCILAAIQIHSEQPHQVSVCYIPNFDMKQESPKTAYNRKKTVKSTT